MKRRHFVGETLRISGCLPQVFQAAVKLQQSRIGGMDMLWKCRNKNKWIDVIRGGWRSNSIGGIPMAGLICKHCGRVLTGTENFCPNCGAKIEADSEQMEDVLEQNKSGAEEPRESTESKKDADAEDARDSEEPKRPEFHMDEEFDWDLDGYPTGERKTKDIDFDWNFTEEQANRRRRDPIMPAWGKPETRSENKADKTLTENGVQEDSNRPKNTESLFSEDEGRAESPLDASDKGAESSDAEDARAEADAEKTAEKKIDTFFSPNEENENYQQTLDWEFENLSGSESGGNAQEALRDLARLASYAQEASVDPNAENDADFEQKVEESADEFLRKIEREKEISEQKQPEEQPENETADAEKKAGETAAAEGAQKVTPEEAASERSKDKDTDAVFEAAEKTAASPNSDLNDGGQTESEESVSSRTSEDGKRENAGGEPEEPEKTKEDSSVLSEEASEDAQPEDTERNTAENASEGENLESGSGAEGAAKPSETEDPSEHDALSGDSRRDEAGYEPAGAEKTEMPKEPGGAKDTFFVAAKNDAFSKKEEKPEAEKKPEEPESPEKQELKKDLDKIFEEEKIENKKEAEKPRKGLKILAVIIIILILLEVITIFLKYKMPDAEITLRMQSIYDAIYGNIYDFFHGIFG